MVLLRSIVRGNNNVIYVCKYVCLCFCSVSVCVFPVCPSVYVYTNSSVCPFIHKKVQHKLYGRRSRVVCWLAAVQSGCILYPPQCYTDIKLWLLEQWQCVLLANSRPQRNSHGDVTNFWRRFLWHEWRVNVSVYYNVKKDDVGGNKFPLHLVAHFLSTPTQTSPARKAGLFSQRCSRGVTPPFKKVVRNALNVLYRGIR